MTRRVTLRVSGRGTLDLALGRGPLSVVVAGGQTETWWSRARRWRWRMSWTWPLTWTTLSTKRCAPQAVHAWGCSGKGRMGA
eukprot:27503-Rhodomonas_salina.1